MLSKAKKTELDTLQQVWTAAWPQALSDWSPFVQLHEPKWCWTKSDEKNESLTGSFAMIRLVDHSVVISLRQIVELGLENFAVEILAHEIGHHVYCPADLTDNGRLLARIRRGLPSCEPYAPMIANLYADLLINDRLQRSCGRNMAGVYQALKSDATDSDLWLLYLRMYEILWSLPPKTLASKDADSPLNMDAVLGARLIRSYAKDWLGGAGRFACLMFPYVSKELEAAREAAKTWCDTVQAGANGFPDGLTELDDDEISGNIHPAEDPALSGLEPIELGNDLETGQPGRVSSAQSGRKSIKSYRDPFEYAEIMKASGTNLSPREIAIRYYRERAIPYLVPFPMKQLAKSSDPLPEGIELWDPSNDIDQIDWVNTLIASPTVIPGVTTRQRIMGQSVGSEPEKQPFNLYLGVDCSGSMRDPALTMSYPVLAGAVMALSALRAKARVKVVLSGEPGKSISTDGFERDQEEILKTLVNYLGTGYSFGIHRLAETFGVVGRKSEVVAPTHILVLSDYDMFTMLEERISGKLGWDFAREAASVCGGGATYVLQLPGFDSRNNHYAPMVDRMKKDGWGVHLVNSLEELIDFAKQFSRRHYQKELIR